ncbi:tetraacyldisaccharide 4'-kinase [Craterilacuibacter sinensis]|uniref:Tetraacyldisaccharide 4'-kinase n=1 Tax=Craterilacuibacter sinensis TaxID=2686017 RepID=A0A845BGB5_9NEIS|nr:tetraacyldisaccharide 4'-kinase [Craterilacuibacter sinensis]MXR35787.1 tetraacyldisaccharide 4'-kinase [Craterilacuibacter sinensis]
MNSIEKHWYAPRLCLSLLLAPLACLFALLSGVRRWAFKSGLCKTHYLSVPVVVIGNINVGGVGKTPLALSLIASLQARGLRVGVISRGYGGSHAVPTLLDEASRADEVGDEPLLFAASGVPVVVGRDRVAAGRCLLQARPDLDLILSDDGLQHYRLGRALEIVVMDGARGVGNGRLLPAGPLREPLSRLACVDALVVNGERAAAFPDLPPGLPVFAMTLEPGRFVSLADPAQTRAAADFAGQRLVALAGIGHPQRFFATLAGQGIVTQRNIAFPDHHIFSAEDVPDDADAVLVTTKDAVKLQCVNHARLWALPVAARLAPDLADWIIVQLKRR